VRALRATGRAEVIAICRRNPEKLAMAQKALGGPQAYTDWQEMLDKEELDAVLVTTPPYAHAELTLGALERGLHVLVEKPMALSSRDAWAMVDAAERADCVLSVAYGPRNNGKWRTAKRAIDEGLLGSVRQINLTMNRYHRRLYAAGPIERSEEDQALWEMIRKGSGVPEEFYGDWGHWYKDPEKGGGGGFADTGPHNLDLALWLAGAPPVEVSAFTENDGLPVDAFVNTQARLANGVLLSMTFADSGPESVASGRYTHLAVMGTKALLFLDGDGSIWVHKRSGREKLELTMPDTTKAAGFVSAILDGAPNPSPGRDGAYVVEFILATYTSAAEGRIVRIEHANG